MSAPPPTAGPPAVTSYQVPSLGWRILGGALRLIPLVVLLIGVPVAILTFLQAHGIPLPIPAATVEIAGIAITVLVVARYILMPTAAFGPLSIATSVVTLVYLWVVLADATYRFAIPGSGFALSLAYSDLILLLLIVPALSLGAGVLALIEDATHPQERLPFDYPP